MHISAKFLIAAMGLSLAGCTGSHVNRTMYSVHQPVVTRTNYAIDLDTSGGGVPATERQRLSEWMAALDAGYGDRVSIDFGPGYADASTRAAVSSVVQNYDAQVVDTAPVTANPVIPGTVRVVLSRSSASVPSCPDWSKKSEANYTGGNHTNYGCATNSNLAAMIADPADLLGTRRADPIDTLRRTEVLSKYRAGQSTATERTEQETGAVSNVVE